MALQPIFPTPPSGTPAAPAAGATSAPNPAAGASESINPELFTGIVRGVLSTLMGSLGQTQNDSESIAQFMQRLSQATNIFISTEEPTGAFSRQASAHSAPAGGLISPLCCGCQVSSGSC